jgi:GWxTD domain-containing protein
MAPLLIGSMVCLYACFSTNKVSVQNIADLYHTDFHYLHPQFALYHAGDSTSQLYYKIDESELLYIRRNQQDSFSSQVKIQCKVTSAYEAADILDSTSVTLRFASISNTKTGFATGYFPIKLRPGNVYLLTITTTDMVSKKEDISYMDGDRQMPGNKQNYLVKDLSNGEVLFPYYADSATTVSITCNQPQSKLTVNYYKRDFPIAPPPFLTLDTKPFVYKADSSFVITAESDGTFKIKLPPTGFYHIQADTSKHSGLTLYRYQKYYPNIGEAGQMVAPLRFITSTDEYNRFGTSANVKKAVDEFWLNIASGSQDRARTLIRTYYNRVKDANRYFTSYVDGWKTDRGMVYIIFGPPTVVYRTSTSESWTYSEDRNFMQLNFTFQKVGNPFSDNDFALDRSAQYRNLWYNAVDIWREGRIY